MTASERSYVGLARQTARGTPITEDAAFDYFLFTEGAAGVQNQFVPLDQEAGGGAMLRDIIKAAASSGGAFTLIPRPHTLGHFLRGILGAAPTTTGATAPYTHAFTLPLDQFAAPYYTVRSAPGNLFSESLQDCRLAALGLTWKAADFVRGSLAFVGGAAVPPASPVAGAPAIDTTPPFIAPKGAIEVPTGTPVKVLSGGFTAALDIPLEEQFRVGSYWPDDLSINSRMFVLSLNVKVEDDVLYKRIAYDPASGSEWAASVYREADIRLEFASDPEITAGNPYRFTIKANGQAHGPEGNIAWSCTPLSMRAGRQVTMNLTGTFLASPDPVAVDPIEIEVVNATAGSEYA